MVHSGRSTSTTETADQSSGAEALSSEAVAADPDEPASSREEPPPPGPGRRVGSQKSRVESLDPTPPVLDTRHSTLDTRLVTPDGCKVELVLLVDDVDPPLAGYVDRLLARAADLSGIDRGQLTIAAVDDARMADLHQQFKGAEGTTDVLTFDFRCSPDEPVEGDVVVCVDEARRQATGRGHAIRAEVLLYAVHGLLHLLGYDDHEPESAAAMHDREDALLAAIGVGPIYATRRPGAMGDAP